MPTLIQPAAIKVIESGEGWRCLGLAGQEAFGSPAMVARRWLLEPGAQGPALRHGEQDQLLYVIRGSGLALVDGAPFPLAGESVLWLEPGERYWFVAGPDGLEILQGYAPGE